MLSVRVAERCNGGAKGPRPERAIRNFVLPIRSYVYGSALDANRDHLRPNIQHSLFTSSLELFVSKHSTVASWVSDDYDGNCEDHYEANSFASSLALPMQ
jgi:hypothetical protein